MAYNGGCIIGVELRGTQNRSLIYLTGRDSSVVGVTGNSIIAETGTIAARWPISDGAFTPMQDATDTSSYGTPYAAALASDGLTGSSGWGLLADMGEKVAAYPMRTYCKAQSTASTFSVVVPDEVTATTIYDATPAQRTRTLAFNFGNNAGAVALQYSSPNSSYWRGAYWGEVSGCLVTELPNGPEIATYNRVRTAPSTVDYKTLDGAIRRYVTGPATTSISATFRWSDNGAVAAALDQYLTLAADNALPLVVYVPSGIYYNGPFLDLVVPTNNPHPTMPAPGVYELTIEGTCQP